ncbi:uncharacterized protein MONOS_13237 [Monocercomonoides exilis]|uniref:uncharacterized protein n=1 Tax=Monocercomonoides exilis TaxID=2049356 RepID=UPI00355A8306|nr:hypothetical protein MONOS_13237 [Monocercomonoides exilis]|eukprot:MONOS_13237.1-p1 / transcript=MONOS_13237.1 / gene=MONOS_13237 / organism=Monocercomonoides_exilis_PA203 / gene_product=unspecified product / transcript_product=unspecified product / location=Mono_scaffold00795:17680-25868(-) / protein_length=2705 / sequence_SO=supercontig / SO=protein_coding / is_pseudo=false
MDANFTIVQLHMVELLHGTVFYRHNKQDIVISNCSISGGSAPLGAGGLDISDNDHNTSLLIQFCLFENNTVQKDTHAADIYLGKGYDADTAVNEIKHCFTLSNAPRHVVICARFAEECGDRGVAHDDWLPSPPSEIRISKDGSDINTCGNIGSECKTVEYGVTRWRSQLNQSILLFSENYIENYIEINSKHIEIIGVAANESKVMCLANSTTVDLFYVANGFLKVGNTSFVCVFNRTAIHAVSSGTLQLELCAFTKDLSSNLPSTQSLLQVDEGELNMRSVKMSGFAFAQGCAVAINDCKMSTLVNASFSNIVSNQNGGCMSVVCSEALEESCSISFDTCEFDTCCTQGDDTGGGGLFICLSAGFSCAVADTRFDHCTAAFEEGKNGKGGGLMMDLRDENSIFNISGTQFTSSNNAAFGKNAFVHSPNLNASILLPRFGFWQESDSPQLLMGSDKRVPNTIIPLEIFLKARGDFVFVSSTGSDNVCCGHPLYPCETLSYSFDVQASVKKKIKISQKIELKEKLALNEVGYDVGERNLPSTITVIGTGPIEGTGGLITTSVDCSFAAITFTLSSTSLAPFSSLFDVRDEELFMTDCALTISEDLESSEIIEYSFALVSEGSINFAHFLIPGMLCVSQPIISITGSHSSCEIDFLSVNKVTVKGNKGLIYAADSRLLTIHNSSIESCSMDESSLIEISSIQTLEAKNTSFLTITCSKGNGSCFDITTGNANERQLSIENCSFDGCAVAENGSGGGGLFCSLSSPRSLSITLCTFNGCEAPSDMLEGFGGGIFFDLVDSDAGFVVSDPSFATESPNKAKHGSDLFVCSPDLKASITMESLPFAAQCDHGSFNNLQGYYGEDHENAVPLVLLLEDVGQTLYASLSNGANTFVCGFSDYPCASLDYGMQRLAQINGKAITISTSTEIRNEMCLQNAEVKSASNSKMKISFLKAVSTLSGKVLTVSGNSSIEQAMLAIPSSFNNDVLSLIFLSSESNFSMVECLLSMQEGEVDQVSFQLFELCGGILKMDHCSLQSDCISHAPIGARANEDTPSDAITLKIMNSVIGSYPLICVIPSTNKHQKNDNANNNVLTLFGCSFEKITREDNDANCAILFSSLVSMDIECDQWNATDIRGTQSDEGGALKAVIGSTGSFKIKNSTFTKCCAESETKGKGGALFVDCSASDAFLFADITFEMCNAHAGKNLFVISSDLNLSITAERLAFAISDAEASNNLFIGSDSTKTDFDLLRFLIPFISSEICLSKNNGWDVSRCGSEGEPCMTMQYGQMHFPSSSDESDSALNKLVAMDEVLVDCEVDVTNMVVTSKNVENHSLLKFNPAINPKPGIEDVCSSTLASTGECSFLNLGICCSCSAEWHHSNLICSSGRNLAFDSCKFSGVIGETITYCVVVCLSGTCELSFCSFESMKCAHHIAMTSSLGSLSLTNTTTNNIELTGKSVIAAQQQQEACRANDGEGYTIQLKCCTLHSLQQSTPSDPSIVQCLTSKTITVSILNTSIKSCGSSASEKGGGVIMKLNEGGLLECCYSNLTGCFCSTTGRGGAMYLDCSAAETEELAPFKFVNSTFLENRAFRGRDLFVKCSKIDSQIGLAQFQLDFRPPFVKELAIWGCTDEHFENEEDLLLIVIVYQNEIVFVSSTAENNTDSRQCGAASGPCTSLNTGLNHVIPSVFSNLLIDKECAVSGEASLRDVTMKSMQQENEKGVIAMNAAIEKKSNHLLACSSRVAIEHLTFLFGNAFSSEHLCLLCVIDGNLSVTNALFTQEASSQNSDSLLNCSIIQLESGRLTINECCFASLHICSSCLTAIGGEYCSFSNTNITHVDAKRAMNLHNLTKLLIHQMHVAFCLFEDSSMILHDCRDCQIEKLQMNKVQSKANMIAFSSDRTDVKTSIRCYLLEFVNISVSAESLLFIACEDSSTEMSNLTFDGITLSNGCVVNAEFSSSKLILKQSLFSNITRNSVGPCCLSAESPSSQVAMEDCSFEKCKSASAKGSIISIAGLKQVEIASCTFDGANAARNTNENEEHLGDICQWNGSVVDMDKSSAMIKDTTIANASNGGLTANECNVTMLKGEMLNNNPKIEKYPSVRRNIICFGSAALNIGSLKGGDGARDNSSLWILNNGCKLEGLAAGRQSSFFIPTLESVEANDLGSWTELRFHGSLLLPCNLSYRLSITQGDASLLNVYPLETDQSISENEAHSSILSSIVSDLPDSAEVSVSILFGDLNSPSSTASFILKNRSVPKANGGERVVEGGKEEKFSWILIVCIVIVVVLLIALVIFVVRWRKQKRRTEELEVIVEDTVRKDPKAFEMVTMEMSPEAQWRRAEKEAEKSNEERIKKRVYEKSLGHSESSEHLLSESGSTEYILGRDSDKIPEWALEKVDEKEEEIRKRTPSPSISSTSTTDTSDTESTFVRSESLCPTTSSMSNLVDAMACSSPHEKLIVDLRDSLFMLLHGRNEKKEMAIGSLQQREQTAAQILFWVANLALHSFDEMDNPVQSLANLSPHVVLFSEHMVICIVMHSECSSDDSSDSSSISSTSTIITSTSDCSTANRNGRDSPPPSSAFEDDDDYRKECLRWKAPELMANRNAVATKKTVSFSIGMMLWECLTLQIPFGEYEAEIAARKIVNGERPNMGNADDSRLGQVMRSCWSENYSERLSLNELKREFIKLFPAGSVMLTVTDAITFESSSKGNETTTLSTTFN